MNSASLRFVPVAELEEQGYGEFRNLFHTIDTDNTAPNTEEHAS